MNWHKLRITPYLLTFQPGDGHALFSRNCYYVIVIEDKVITPKGWSFTRAHFIKLLHVHLGVYIFLTIDLCKNDVVHVHVVTSALGLWRHYLLSQNVETRAMLLAMLLAILPQEGCIFLLPLLRCTDQTQRHRRPIDTARTGRELLEPRQSNQYSQYSAEASTCPCTCIVDVRKCELAVHALSKACSLPGSW